MSKINSNLFNDIFAKIKSDDNVYCKIKLETSKIFFGFIGSIYFFLYLATIAGFYKEYLSGFLYAFYSVFVFSVLVLCYDLIIFAIKQNTDNNVNSYKIPIGIFFSLVYLLILAIHFGLKI